MKLLYNWLEVVPLSVKDVETPSGNVQQVKSGIVYFISKRNHPSIKFKGRFLCVTNLLNSMFPVHCQ